MCIRDRGKSELSLNYSFGYRDFKGIRTEETAYYHLNDGSIYTIQRNDLASRNRSLSNQMKLTYNLADSSRYVFQASLSGDFSHVPGDFSQKQIVDGAQTYKMCIRDRLYPSCTRNNSLASCWYS